MFICKVSPEVHIQWVCFSNEHLISLYWILSKSHARQFCNLSKNDHWEVFQVSAYYLGHEDP